jgi:hypothetical protein
MNNQCGKQWTRKFLYDNFTKSFISGPYKVHRENVLLEKQRALLPDTQPFVEQLLREERVRREKIEIRQNIKLLNANLERLVLEAKAETVSEVKRHIRKEINEVRNTIQQFRDRVRELYQEPDAEVKERRQFIKPCGVDSCRGFLSTQWKCGMCETWACPDCHAIIGKSKDAPHTCDPNDVETAKMVQRETRPCPTCHVPIHKLDGCDQMWCTQCHTAFSYKSGAIEKKIHNPHYYEWLRETKGQVPRENHPDAIGGGGCRIDGELTIEEVTRSLRRPNVSDTCRETLFEVTRAIIHLRSHQRDEHAVYETDTRYLRSWFMRNMISEHQFKTQIQRTEKKYLYRSEMHDVHQLVVTAGTDLVRRAVKRVRKSPTPEYTLFVLNSFLNKAEMLSIYANKMMVDIKNVYGRNASLHLLIGPKLNLLPVASDQLSQYLRDAEEKVNSRIAEEKERVARFVARYRETHTIEGR